MNSLNFNKNWYKSKTIWGGIVAAVGSLFGLVIGPVEVNQTVDAVNAAREGGIDIADIITLAGAVVAIYGRINATEKIASTPAV